MMNRRNVLAAALAVVAAAGGRQALASSENATVPEAGDYEAFAISRDDEKLVNPRFRVRTVDYETSEAAGTIIIDVDHKYLYLLVGGGKARRYGVGVGRQGFEWSGEAVIRRKAKWPKWTPPRDMIARDPEAAKWPNGMPGGPHNPLGARALYLFQGNVDTLYRIHGTREPRTIGTAVSSGCIRLLNADVVELYERVRIGAKVVVLPSSTQVAGNKPGHGLRVLFQRDR